MKVWCGWVASLESWLFTRVVTHALQIVVIDGDCPRGFDA